MLRGDTREWTIPGGSAEEGSTFASTALTELREETGLIGKKQDLMPFACISDPEFMVRHFPNGDVNHAFSVCFALRSWTGTLQPDGDESLELRFVSQAELPRNLATAARRAIALYNRFRMSLEFQVG